MTMDALDAQLAAVLMKGLPLGIMALDTECRILLWNSWLAKHSGLEKEEVLGRNLFELFPEIKERKKDKYILDCIRKTKPALLSPFLHRRLIPLMITKGQKSIPMLQNVRIYPYTADGGSLGVILLIEDMTETIFNEREIARLNRVLAGIRNVNQLITRVHSESELFSESCRILTGEVGYETVWAVIREDGALRLAAFASPAQDHKLPEGIHKRFGPDICGGGSPVCALASGGRRVIKADAMGSLQGPCGEFAKSAHARSLCSLPLRLEETVVGCLNLLSKEPEVFTGEELELLEELAGDISFAMGNLKERREKKRAEELLLQTERLEAVSELAAGVAHNFNNILQIVLGHAQLALSDLKNRHMDSVEDSLEHIVKSSEVAAQIVQRLQNFASQDPKRASKEEVIDLSSMAREALELTEIWWRTEPEKKGIEINVNQGLVPGSMIACRKFEILEVLVNLIRNAVEAMPQGGDLTARTFVDGSEVVFQMMDTGVGIPEEHKNRVFEPFFTTKGVQRRGLGLAACYGIVKSHDGTITIKNRNGGGALAMMRLPLAPIMPTPPDVALIPTFDLKLSILAVDDMEGVLTGLRAGLMNYGQTVFTALSGAEALKILDTHEVDLVICDLGMPRMNGWDVGKRIKAMCEQRGAPRPRFIMFSGWGLREADERKMEECGVDAMEKKPVSVPKLLNVIKNLFPKAGPEPRS